MSETRVVLVKPGDLLIFGNVGSACYDAESLNILGARLKELLGISYVVFFEDDIDLAAVPSGEGA